MITIRRAVMADATALTHDLRPFDRAECEAMGIGVAEAIESAVFFSDQSFCAVDGGDVVALWGYAERRDGYEVWCLTGCAVDRHRKRMLVENRAFVERMAARGLLYAWVLADYTAARRWLAWLGFHEDGNVERNGRTFLKVVRNGASDDGDAGGRVRDAGVRSGRRRHTAELAGPAERGDCRTECADGGATGRR